MKARQRVSAIDILKTDYEYCDIKYYTEGNRNDLGEPQGTLTTRSTDVKCAIDPLTRMPSYVRQSGLRDMVRQGIVERALFIMTSSADEAIEPGDVVVDYDGTTFDVLHVIRWYTHTEAFLRKMS
jgi:hypothetical protein